METDPKLVTSGTDILRGFVHEVESGRRRVERREAAVAKELDEPSVRCVESTSHSPKELRLFRY
jgi:hypothetical protein